MLVRILFLLWPPARGELRCSPTISYIKQVPLKIALHPPQIPILVRAENRAELGVGPPCDQKIKKRVIQKSEVVSAENKLITPDFF